MKNLLLSTFLFLGLSIPIFGQFNLGLGLGTGGPRSYFLEVEPKIEASERVELGLSIIAGKNNTSFGNTKSTRTWSIYHLDSKYKITASGFFLGLGTGLTKNKGEMISSSGIYEWQNTQFLFMPKIGF